MKEIVSSAGPRVLMTTEGTYPFVVGGVSTWCKLTIAGLPGVRWQVLPVAAGGRDHKPLFEVPPYVDLLPPLRLWTEQPPPGGVIAGAGRRRAELPGELARALLGWDASPAVLVEALTWCRLHPQLVRPAFRHRRGFASFVDALRWLAAESSPEVAAVPALDTSQMGALYHTLYWIARAAAHPTPPTDLIHVTAAGWAGIPAVVHKAIHGTPMMLTEHGVYVREAYLAGVRNLQCASSRTISSRLARSLARASYHCADVIIPVTNANSWWEQALGAPRERIRVVPNGMPISQAALDPLPGHKFVLSVGRLDPLKDIHTMLRVAVEVIRRIPEARFFHIGPTPEGGEAYANSCYELHTELGLGDRFKFMGFTKDPDEIVRAADVMIMTSISEGFPLSVLEAMLKGRPVVSTGVGGVEAEAILGSGVVAPPGDVQGLALGVVTLLKNPELARQLGKRGFARAIRNFSQDTCERRYRDLICELTGTDRDLEEVAA